MNIYDDYDEKNNNEEKSVNKSKIIIIVSLIIVTIILLFFMFNKGGNKTLEEKNYIINIYPEDIIIPLDDSQQIVYEVKNNDEVILNAEVKFTIDDLMVASIEDLVIKGNNYGKTTLNATFTSENGTVITKKKDIIVADGNSNVRVNDISLAEGDLKMSLNGVYVIPLVIQPSNGFIENKTFTSSNNNVVSVDNKGNLTAISEGNAIITINVNNGDFIRELNVTVNNENEGVQLVVNPTSIKINSLIDTMKEGKQENILYKILPDNADKSVTWTSSNSDVISVDNGIIKAIKPGEAKITVTTINGLSDSINIKVEKDEILVNNIMLSLSELSLIVGQSETITPTIYPEEATDKSLSYSLNNSGIVSISPSSDSSSVTITGLSIGSSIMSIKSSNGITTNLSIIVVNNSTGGSSSSGGSSCGKCKSDCGAGKYCNCGKCVSCPSGNYCYNNTKTACPAGKGSIPNSSSYQDCSYCAKGLYSTGNGKGCIACPSGTTTKSVGSTSKDDCNVTVTPSPTPIKCAAGYYLSSNKCTKCEIGYYCTGDNKRTWCGSGKTTKSELSTSEKACIDK